MKNILPMIVLSVQSCLLLSCTSFKPYLRFLEISGSLYKENLYLVVAKETGNEVIYVSPDPKPTYYPKTVSFYLYQYDLETTLRDQSHVSPKCTLLFTKPADEVPRNREEVARHYIPEGAINYRFRIEDIQLSQQESDFVQHMVGRYAEIRYIKGSPDEQWYLVQGLDDYVHVLDQKSRVRYLNRIAYFDMRCSFAGDIFDIDSQRYAMFLYDNSQQHPNRVMLSDRVIIWYYKTDETKTVYLNSPPARSLGSQQK